MKTKSLVVFICLLGILAIIAIGCGSVKNGTITVPGTTVTIPAVTVTLPGKTTTIPSAVVTMPEFTTTIPQEVELNTLPSTPITITSHKGLIDSLKGNCLVCHGDLYNHFPTPPIWNGAENGSSHNTGIYVVVPGSIQDHTGRTPDTCLGCHAVAK